jgi:hypothetical protein
VQTGQRLATAATALGIRQQVRIAQLQDMDHTETAASWP